MEQLMIPLRGIDRHHYSPAFVMFWDAWFDFEETLDDHVDFVYPEEHENYHWDDEKGSIGVPRTMNSDEQSGVSRDDLELWTARLTEATNLIKAGKMDMLYAVRDSIT